MLLTRECSRPRKLLWEDILVHRSKDVPWRIKCRRLVDHVYSTFSQVRTGPEPFTQWTKVKRWETKMMMSLFRFKTGNDKTWVDFHTRSCEDARKIWIKLGLRFLFATIAESLRRAIGSVCDQKPNAVIDSLKQVFWWRNSRWWHAIHTEGVKDDPQDHTWTKHEWCGTIEVMSGTRSPQTGLVERIGSAKGRNENHSLTRQHL